MDRLAGYAIEAVLGRGGFGVVVRARGSDGRVAIKLAHPHREARDRLARERDVLAAVGPPLAPALLGHGASDDGSPFLVMELVDAPTLRAPEVRARGVAALARPLVVAVAALHARGFVHRDLKPENVFVMPDRVVLVDFGLARRTGDGDRTRTGAVAGTALYAAPEQLAGAAVTPASDVYALGAMLYELATGGPPFAGGDGEVRVAHRSHRPVPPRELGPIDPTGEDPRPAGKAVGVPTPRAPASPIDAGLEALILDCLAKHPASRPQAAELVARLDRREPGAPPAALPVQRTRAICSVVAFEPAGPDAAGAIAEVIAAQRGELAAIAGGCWTAVFSAVDAARPDARAARAARALVGAGLVSRALVERREVVVRTRADGAWVLSNLHDGARRRLAELACGTAAIADDERQAPAAAVASDAGAAGEPGFVGRAAILAELVAEGRAAAGAVTLVVGEDSAGRTRLAHRLGAVLAAAGRRGLIDGDEALRIPGAVAAAALAAALPADAARRVHAAAAAHYQARIDGCRDRRAWLPRLAPHVAALGDGDRAARLLVELADLLRDAHDYLAAEAWYGRALELAHDPAVELAARRSRALMRHRLGRHEDAIADLARGRELARAAGDRDLEAALLLDEATVIDWIGEVARSAARLDQASALLGDAPRPALHVRRLVAEGRRTWRTTADAAAAVAWLERALAAAAPLGDDVYEDRIAAMVMLVYILPRLARLDDAERLAAQALAICEERGDRHHLLAVLNNRQVVSMHRGLVERAIADLERAAELGRELGMPLVRYTTRLSLADIHRRIGDAAGALYHAGEARLVETAGSAAGSRQSAAILLLQIHGMRGEVGAARELLAAIRPGELHEDEVAILRAMLQLRRVIARVATGALSVLLLGETGVGKEVLAELVHSSSPRSHRPFLRLNCAAMTETLLESELFGHEKGAFTGAIASKPGLLETACGGTVFLDEIGELSPAIQVKLLRVLEDRMVNPVGGLKPRPIDVRFVAATNRDLENEIARGRFRQDLYYRLAGITLVIPPLRERVGEIVPLARVFLAAACPDPRRIPAIDSAAIDLLTSHAWPGNIRELRNVVERAALLASDGAIGVEHLPDALRAPRRAARDPAAAPPAIADEPGGDREQPARSATCALEALYPGGPERERIISTLELCRGNQTRAAQVLGMSRRTLLYRLERYGLPRPRKGS